MGSGQFASIAILEMSGASRGKENSGEWAKE